MSIQARLLKVAVQPVFVIVTDDGQVEEAAGQPIEVPGKAWSAFAGHAFGEADLAGIAQAWAEQQASDDGEVVQQ